MAWLGWLLMIMAAITIFVGFVAYQIMRVVSVASGQDLTGIDSEKRS